MFPPALRNRLWTALALCLCAVCLPALNPTLHAQSVLPADVSVTGNPGGIVLTLGLLAIVVSILSNVVSIWHRNKRQPPIEQYVDRELSRLEGRMDSRLSQLTNDVASMRSYNAKNSRELHERIEALGKTISASLNDIHRSIGRIEGRTP